MEHNTITYKTSHEVVTALSEPQEPCIEGCAPSIRTEKIQASLNLQNGKLVNSIPKCKTQKHQEAHLPF